MSTQAPECPQCGAVVFPDSSICETCGTRVFEACPSCGVERLASVPTCPRCGAGWADDPEEDAPPIGALAEAWEASAEHDFVADDGSWAEEPWEPSRRRPPVASFLTVLSAVLLLAAITVGVFAFVRDRPEGTSGGAPLGTEPPPAASPATTAPADDITTTTAPEGEPALEPAGDPIDVDDLRLAVDGIGPLEFGAPANEVLGRLAASLGRAHEDQGPLASDGAYGTCPGDQVRITRWGPLVVVGRGDPLVFAGYRMDLQHGTGGPAQDIRTLSGLSLGDTVADLERIYERFEVDYVEVPGLGQVFELRDGAGRLLIWGPVTSTDEDGLVRGIYSPDPCPAS